MLTKEPESYVILVGGVPGTGKTVFSRLLSTELNCDLMEASEVAKTLGIAKRDPSGRHTYIIEDFNVLTSYIKEVLRKNCIVVASVYPFDLYRSLNNFTPFLIVLRTDPRVLVERLERRGWARPKILENVLAEALGSVYDSADEESLRAVIELNTTTSDPETCLNLLFKKLRENDYGAKIDWLEILDIVDKVSKWLEELNLYKYGLPE